jgi:hypothetical protein
MGMGGQLHTPAALPPGKRPRTLCTGGPRSGLGECGKSGPRQDSFPGLSSP